MKTQIITFLFATLLSLTAQAETALTGDEVAELDRRDALAYGMATGSGILITGNGYLLTKSSEEFAELYKRQSQVEKAGSPAAIEHQRTAKSFARHAKATRWIARGVGVVSVFTGIVAARRLVHAHEMDQIGDALVCGPEMICEKRTGFDRILTSRGPIAREKSDQQKRDLLDNEFKDLKTDVSQIACDDEAGLAVPGIVSRPVKECVEKRGEARRAARYNAARNANDQIDHFDITNDGPVMNDYEKAVAQEQVNAILRAPR